MKGFIHYELRTTEPDAARAFYTALLGHSQLSIWPLHEQARARGAMPHWLGHIAVGQGTDLEDAGQRFVERGAVLLSPMLATPDRGSFLVLRDPGGAVVALNGATEPLLASKPDIAWHVLNTNGVTQARQNYKDLFAWQIEQEASSGFHGDFYAFAWTKDSREQAGAMADLAGRPAVHPHWLYFFNVAALDSAVALIRETGGTAMEPVPGPAGARVSVCEDPQGAAFGLYQQA